MGVDITAKTTLTSAASRGGIIARTAARRYNQRRYICIMCYERGMIHGAITRHRVGCAGCAGCCVRYMRNFNTFTASLVVPFIIVLHPSAPFACRPRLGPPPHSPSPFCGVDSQRESASSGRQSRSAIRCDYFFPSHVQNKTQLTN